MKPSVYIETSIVSYYAGRPSRELIIAGRQQTTRDWWESERQKFSLYVSALVLQECRRGEVSAVRQREWVLKDIPLLSVTPATEKLAETLVTKGPIPAEYPEDALHIALASTGGMDYLLTWNFRHINNARMKSDVERIVGRSGYECPVICTPEELLESDYENPRSPA